MKNWSIQRDSDDKNKKDNNKEEGFCQRFGVGIIQWIYIHSNLLKNWYVISQRKDNKERELNMLTNMKISNEKKLKALVNSDVPILELINN